VINGDIGGNVCYLGKEQIRASVSVIENYVKHFMAQDKFSVVRGKLVPKISVEQELDGFPCVGKDY
jgi:hypothetical protein